MSENSDTKKVAIVLFNLGGPDSLSAVKPFLFNLFYDKAIITLPNPFRWLIAKIISITRAKKAKSIYSQVGNKSPILEETEAQKNALVEKLKQNLGANFKIFICMRHWRPNSTNVVKEVMKYGPSEIILLPLYPQFSTTTTGSSINDFKKSWQGSNIPIKIICCYPTDKNFITSHVSLINESLEKLEDKNNFRILFSAHGLPVKIIHAGDPYQWQIEQTVKNIVNNIGINNLDYKITYQSRVGPVEWLKPDTSDEIKVAGQEKKSLIIVPISFVSEHVETLVELDIEYREIANKYNLEYIRVPTLRTNEIFIDSISKIICSNFKSSDRQTKRICPKDFINCLCK